MISGRAFSDSYPLAKFTHDVFRQIEHANLLKDPNSSVISPSIGLYITKFKEHNPDYFVLLEQRDFSIINYYYEHPQFVKAMTGLIISCLAKEISYESELLEMVNFHEEFTHDIFDELIFSTQIDNLERFLLISRVNLSKVYNDCTIAYKLLSNPEFNVSQYRKKWILHLLADHPLFDINAKTNVVRGAQSTFLHDYIQSYYFIDYDVDSALDQQVVVKILKRPELDIFAKDYRGKTVRDVIVECYENIKNIQYRFDTTMWGYEELKQAVLDGLKSLLDHVDSLINKHIRRSSLLKNKHTSRFSLFSKDVCLIIHDCVKGVSSVKREGETLVEKPTYSPMLVD